MGKYKLVFRESVSKDLRTIPNRNVNRILKRVDELAGNPRPPGIEKLSGDNRYRVRQGIYRIIYEIEDEALSIIVVKVGHRRDVYK
jgi:mRNA interferase RelE/StbE